ncbi:uncharacterized protein [Penaeus vannamei]|uniref:uncharacterized protein n=1 Tax=Penaeus vannamei TaxID=6689 RepID=UPI00387F3CF9
MQEDQEALILPILLYGSETWMLISALESRLDAFVTSPYAGSWGEKMPEERRKSLLVSIFKNKGNVQTCSNYSGIDLISHASEIWERVVEARLRRELRISEEFYGFVPRRGTKDAIFALIALVKYRGQKLFCMFVDLEKDYDRAPREEL